MYRTRPAHLIPGGFAGDEADELEDVGQRNPGPDCGEVNARHSWSLRTESRGIIRAGATRAGSDGNRVSTAWAVLPSNRPMSGSELADHSSDSQS